MGYFHFILYLHCIQLSTNYVLYAIPRWLTNYVNYINGNMIIVFNFIAKSKH